VVIAISKGWSKLHQSTDDSSSDADEPPLVSPRRQTPPRARLQPRPIPPPTVRRPVPPRLPTRPRAMPPRVPAPVPAERKVKADAEQIRRLVEEMVAKPPPAPPVPVPTQPVATVEPPPPPPQPEPALTATAVPQTIADAPAPPPRSRSSQWMEALRDRQNVRNIIIAVEIIGPPKADTL